jgi:hypothetical protein
MSGAGRGKKNKLDVLESRLCESFLDEGSRDMS